MATVCDWLGPKVHWIWAKCWRIYTGSNAIGDDAALMGRSSATGCRVEQHVPSSALNLLMATKQPFAQIAG
jgi:hypothetical protein